MRNSVSEFGRFQISLRTSSSSAAGGTTVGLAGAETAGAASVDCTDMRRFSLIPALGISFRALTFLGVLPRISVPPISCESGGTGRLACFTGPWLTYRWVRVPPFAAKHRYLSAHQHTNSHPHIPTKRQQTSTQ